jgi:hypothetical protein
MTNSDFIRMLGDLQESFRWDLEPALRDEGPERRGEVRFRIRGRTSGPDGDPLLLDPLRAVCYVRTGKLFPPGAWSEVADALGMEPSVAAVLLAAANDRVWAGAGSHRAPTDHLRTLRRKMLGALGIEEGSLASN